MPKKRKRFITAEDLYSINIITDVRISPTGDHIVYSQQSTDQDTEEKYCNLWVVPTDSGNPQQFTVGDHINAQPRWSPDGEIIAFLSNRADKDKPNQIYLIPFRGPCLGNAPRPIRWIRMPGKHQVNQDRRKGRLLRLLDELALQEIHH